MSNPKHGGPSKMIFAWLALGLTFVWSYIRKVASCAARLRITIAFNDKLIPITVGNLIQQIVINLLVAIVVLILIG